MRAHPPSRAFWKRLEGRWSRERGGATGGAPRGEGRSPALQKANRREARPLSKRLEVSLSPKVHALSLVHERSFSWRSPCASCSSIPFLSLGTALMALRGLLVGDADGRRRSAACGGPARPDEESAGEGSPATKGRSFLFLLFLYAWCGAVCK